MANSNGTYQGRLARLERLLRLRPRALVAVRWPGAEYVMVGGERMPLADWERRHPDALRVVLTWGDPEEP